MLKKLTLALAICHLPFAIARAQFTTPINTTMATTSSYSILYGAATVTNSFTNQPLWVLNTNYVSYGDSQTVEAGKINAGFTNAWQFTTGLSNEVVSGTIAGASTNVWQSCWRFISIQTNYAFWGKSNYLGSTPGIYYWNLFAGDDGGAGGVPPIPLPVELDASYTGTNAWFTLSTNGQYNGFQTTNTIYLAVRTNGFYNDPNILGGGHTIDPGALAVWTVNNFALLGRQNGGYSEGYSFDTPINPNDPANKSYVDAQFQNAFDANWSFSTDTNGVDHLRYMFQNLTPFDIASSFNWLGIISNNPTGFQCVATNPDSDGGYVYTWIPTNEVLYVYQTNLLPSWSLQSSTNLGYKWGFSAYTNYISATNAGIVSFQVPILNEPQRFFRLATPPTNSLTINMPSTFGQPVTFNGGVIGTEPQFLNFLTTNTPGGSGFSSAVSNWYGLATNLTVAGWTTNTSLTVVTNGTEIVSSFTSVVTRYVTALATNGFTLSGAGWAPANGVYLWNAGATGSFPWYWTNVNGLAWVSTSGTPYIYDLPDSLIAYGAVNFPATWTAGGKSGPPFGLSLYTVSPITTSVTTRTVSTLGSALNLSGSPALTVNGTVNAGGYLQVGIPLQNVFQFAAFPNLWVTNCVGLATNWNGVYSNTYTGFYINAAGGTLLIPAGYSGTSIDGTNFATSSSLLCSNLSSFFGGNSSYGNSTNVLGYYALQVGADQMPTNAPLVTALTLTSIGSSGTNGLNGINGTNGLNGTNGTNGLNGVNGTNATLSLAVPTNSYPTVAVAPGAGSGTSATIIATGGHYSDSILTVQLITGTGTIANTNMFAVTYGTPVSPIYVPYTVFSSAAPSNCSASTALGELKIPVEFQTTNGFTFFDGSAALTASSTNRWTFLRLISQ